MDGGWGESRRQLGECPHGRALSAGKAHPVSPYARAQHERAYSSSMGFTRVDGTLRPLICSHIGCASKTPFSDCDDAGNARRSRRFLRFCCVRRRDGSFSLLGGHVMRKHIAISRRTSLLPLAAALVVALTCGTQAQAGDCNDTDQRLESLRPDKGVQAWAASMRLGRGASAAQTQVSPDHRTTVVRNCNDQGSGSLRNAVSNASSGDTIDLGQLHCSTITLTSGAIEIGRAHV